MGGFVWQVLFRLGLVVLVWLVWFGLTGLVLSVVFVRFALVDFSGFVRTGNLFYKCQSDRFALVCWARYVWFDRCCLIDLA